MRHRLLLVLVLLLGIEPRARASDPTEPSAAPPVPAGVPAAAAPAAPEPPFQGVVLGEDVNLRAGPGVNYEIVTKLAGGDKVAVRGEAFGWYLVRPEREVRTFVHKDLIETKGPGVGIVLKDRVNVRSRPAAEATVVGQIGRGDVVRLLDQDGDWIALAAPTEASFYVHRDLVRAVGPLDPKAAAPARPATPPDAGPLVAPEKVRRARELYLAELEKPDLDAMDFAAARTLFEEAARDSNEPEIKRAAEKGLERIRVAERVQEDYRKRVKPIGELLR